MSYSKLSATQNVFLIFWCFHPRAITFLEKNSVTDVMQTYNYDLTFQLLQVMIPKVKAERK